MKPKSALQLATPIMLGYAPIAMTFGLLCYQQGLSFWAALGMSLIIYAGASQFAILGMLALNTATPQIAITVFLINLRHFILSLAYVPHTKTWTLWEKLRFFTILTDENFAVLSATSEIKKEPGRPFYVSLYDYVTWSSFTCIGYGFSKLIPDPKVFGLDFALSAMFIGIIVLFIDQLEQIITFFAAILLMLLFYFVLDCGKFSIILTALSASFVGWRFECRRKST